MSTQPDFPDASVEKQGDGFNVFIHLENNKYIHSSRNPELEAHRQAKQFVNTIGHSKNPVLIGCGAGYILDSLKQENPEFHKKLLIYEPLCQVTSHLELNSSLLKKLYSKKQYITNLNSLILNIKHPFDLFVHPVYQRYFPELIQEIKKKLQNKQNTNNQDTQKKFIRTWINNAFSRILKNEKIEFAVHSKASKKIEAALYCGASPSLFEDLKLLNIKPGHYYPHLFVIASDTSLPVLLKKGYLVDLCISVDTGPGTWFHFANLDTNFLPLEIPLFTWLAGSKYYSMYFKNIIYYRSTLPIDQFLAEGPLEKIPELKNPSNNISGLAIVIANLLNIEKIMMAGFGLLHVQGMTHIPGTGYQHYARSKTNRLNNMVQYQPGGYTLKSQKNTTARDEILKMAKYYDIELIDQFLTLSSKEYLSNSNTAGVKKIQTHTISTPDLRSFLKTHWQSIDKNQWKNANLPIDYLKKGQLLLNN